MQDFSYANLLYKEAARAEIANFVKGLVSESNMGRIAANNIGQNERLIGRVGKGSMQNADKVNLPGVGISVRKSQQYYMPASEYTAHNDFKIQGALQKYQQDNNTHGGFAQVHKVDSYTGLHYHEFVKGEKAEHLIDNIKPEHDRAFSRDYDKHFDTEDPNQHKNHTLGAVTAPMAETVKHLQSNGFPKVWDYAKPDNIIINHDKGSIKDIRSIDLQGNPKGRSAVEDYGRRTENPYAQFQQRKGQEIKAPVAKEDRKKGLTPMIEESKNNTVFHNVVPYTFDAQQGSTTKTLAHV